MITDKQAIENVAANATRLRHQRGWSVRDLAALTGEPVTTVQGALRAKREVRIGTIAKLAHVLGVSIDELVLGTRKARQQTG